MLEPPSILQLEVTKNCNNACIMCHKGQLPEGLDFNRDDISDIALSQVYPVFPHLKYAMLFGDGEPMLYKDFWKIVEDIYKAAPECAIDFICNGSLMNDMNRKKCFDYKIAHIGLSMGGATAKTHEYIRRLSCFHKVIGDFTRLRDEKKKIGTLEPYVHGLIVVMRSNYQEIPEFVEVCDELGIYSVSCQQLFVTHPSMDAEIISSDEFEPYLDKANQIARKRGMGLIHYPLESGNNYSLEPHFSKYNMNDKFLQNKWMPTTDGNIGYCRSQQPWNTVYVLHDGRVVPDCHWWTSKSEIALNECGVLDADTNIMDIWYGERYEKIRAFIRDGIILPQCRGCGLAGGIKKKFRSEKTDHINPGQERLIQISLDSTRSRLMKKINKMSSNFAEKEVFEKTFYIHRGDCSFDIFVCCYNNTVWAQAYLKSLEHTLSENRSIFIIDDSSKEHSDRLDEIVRKSPLSIEIVRDTKISYPLSLYKAFKLSSKPVVCYSDIDMIMRLHHWDSYVENKLKENCLFGIAPRINSHAEANFVVGQKDIMSEALTKLTLEHDTTFIPENWDEDIMPRPMHQEHAYLTYLFKKKSLIPDVFLLTQTLDLNKEAYAMFGMDWRKKAVNRFGDIILDELGQEFLYHNYYSARVQPGGQMDFVPEEEAKSARILIRAIPENARWFADYVENQWNMSLRDFCLAKLRTP